MDQASLSGPRAEEKDLLLRCLFLAMPTFVPDGTLLVMIGYEFCANVQGAEVIGLNTLVGKPDKKVQKIEVGASCSSEDVI